MGGQDGLGEATSRGTSRGRGCGDGEERAGCRVQTGKQAGCAWGNLPVDSSEAGLQFQILHASTRHQARRLRLRSEEPVAAHPAHFTQVPGISIQRPKPFPKPGGRLDLADDPSFVTDQAPPVPFHSLGGCIHRLQSLSCFQTPFFGDLVTLHVSKLWNIRLSIIGRLLGVQSG
jgi:hypothetical protein